VVFAINASLKSEIWWIIMLEIDYDFYMRRLSIRIDAGNKKGEAAKGPSGFI
jgi:hypothetical protein